LIAGVTDILKIFGPAIREELKMMRSVVFQDSVQFETDYGLLGKNW
jgi:hypothetical protein